MLKFADTVQVEISWAERHFILPGHVANQIGMGATRNMVVRSANTRHTEESIRDDLEHIHNLVVIYVRFTGRDAHISTNSVHNSMFARTCMMYCELSFFVINALNFYQVTKQV